MGNHPNDPEGIKQSGPGAHSAPEEAPAPPAAEAAAPHETPPAPRQTPPAPPETPPSPPETPPSPPETPPPPPETPLRSLGRQARVAAAVFTLLGLAVLVWPRGSDSTSVAPGGFLLDATGRAATLGTRLAPVTLVHFWATWCPPCIEEAPGLDRLARDFGGSRDFALLRVAVADSRSRVDSFLGQGAAGVLYDPQWDVAHRYGTEQLPETYLVVRGRIVEKFIGAVNWDDPAVRQKIAARLASGAAGGGGAGMTGSS
jgi:thiol-disulfide isomerase/thioredoxin